MNSELGVDTERMFAKLHLKYTGERYYMQLNQGGVGGYALVNLNAGYRFPAVGFMKELVAQIDMTNLSDRNYISTIGSGGFLNADPAGTAQTVLPGVPRQVFFSLKGVF